MPGVTAALLGDLDQKKHLGKVGTQSDLQLYHSKSEDVEITTLVPVRYPDQLKGLSYSVCGADAFVLVIKEVTAQIGEQILALAAAEARHGCIVLTNYLQPEQIAPFLKGTTLESWEILTFNDGDEDWDRVKAILATGTPEPAEGDVLVPVDHHFDVKGVGAVILGVVARGQLSKGETLYAYPDKVICPVRSIQVHDVDVPTATIGDRVGLALRNTKADQLDRGMVLSTVDADVLCLEKGKEATFQVSRLAFSKQPIGEGSVVQVGFGMQFAPMRIVSAFPGAGETASVTAVLEKPLVVLPGQKGVCWHLDAAPQRVVGTVSIA